MNADTAYSALGPCEDHELQIAEFVEGTLDTSQRASLQRHLDRCARCRVFAHDFAVMHASLARAVPHVCLSPEFDTCLQARIGEVTRSAGKEAIRARAEQEYRGELASLRQEFTWSAALNAVATVAACSSLAVAAESLAPRLALPMAQLPPQALSLGICVVAIVAGLSTTIGLARRTSLPSFR